MKVPQMIAAELRRLTSTRMSVLALVALVCVPVLYGGLYLWANRDPYAALGEVPVALVVADTGAEIGGETRNLGADVAADLQESDTFDWHRVSASEADTGLDDGTYDFAVEIPAGFSAAIASIASPEPVQAEIVLHTSDANNYLASTIGAQAVARIQATVTENVVAEAGLTMLDALHTIRVELAEAADGATRLADGLATAVDGAGSLADGTAQLAEGTARLADGATDLADGARQVADGTAQVAAIADRVGAASAEVAAALPAVRADVADALSGAGVEESRIDGILAELDGVGDDVRSVDGRVADAVSDLDRLNEGAAQVAAGGTRLASAAATAAEGASAVDAGAHDLASGLGRLAAGADRLRDGLAAGVDALPDDDQATRRAQADTLAAPVGVEQSSLTEASSYGAGLAPFFAALAGWIGIYALFLIVKPVSRRAVTALHSPVRVTIAGWATPALLGGIQMIVLMGILALALGFSFAHPGGTLAVMLLASATFAAIVLALNVWLGSVGQFVGLVLMVLQLVTAGGTFPWQTLPAALAALHHVLPMGYVVDAMRQLMYGGNLDRVALDGAVLGTWMLGAGVLAAVGVARMTRFRTLRDLQPSLIG